MIANYHTHTWRCNHATGTEEEYVQSALGRGIRILGFSDHTPYPFPGDYCSSFRMRMELLDGYIDTVEALRRDHRDQIEIHLGLEAEYYPAYFQELLAILRDSPMEYLILGQHFVGNEIGEHYSGAPTADPKILQRYCNQVIEAMQTGLFTYLAHPELIHFEGEHRVYQENMRRICKEAKCCGIPLEINLLGLGTGRHYPNRTFLELAAEEGCAVILGCDAHEPEALADTAIENRALAMAGEFGLEVLDTVSLRPIR